MKSRKANLVGALEGWFRRESTQELGSKGQEGSRKTQEEEVETVIEKPRSGMTSPSYSRVFSNCPAQARSGHVHACHWRGTLRQPPSAQKVNSSTTRHRVCSESASSATLVAVEARFVAKQSSPQSQCHTARFAPVAVSAKHVCTFLAPESEELRVGDVASRRGLRRRQAPEFLATSSLQPLFDAVVVKFMSTFQSPYFFSTTIFFLKMVSKN